MGDLRALVAGAVAVALWAAVAPSALPLVVGSVLALAGAAIARRRSSGAARTFTNVSMCGLALLIASGVHTALAGRTSVNEGLTTIGSAIAVVGLVRLLLLGTRGHPGEVLDALVIAIASGTVVWQVERHLGLTGDLPVASSFQLLALTVAVLVVLAISGLAAARVVRARPALATIAASLLLGWFTNVVVLRQQIAGLESLADRTLTVPWACFYGLLGVGVAHPGFAALGEPRPPGVPTDHARPALFGTALAVPAVLTCLAVARDDDVAALLLGATWLLLIPVVLRRFVVLLRDQAAAETERARSEARFRALIQHATDVVLVLRRDDEVGWHAEYASPAVKRVLGFDPPTFGTFGVKSLIHPDDTAAAIAALTSAGPPGTTPSVVTFRVRHATGGWRWVEATVTDCRGVDGVDGVVVNYRDVSERRHAEELLRHAAEHDGLTGLLHRTGLLAAAADRGSATVLFVDLDRFKQVNDTHGHVVGDGVLVEVARRLESVVRPADLVARLGGDEFVIVCHDIGCDTEAEALGERVRLGVSGLFTVGDVELSIGASVGVAFDPGASLEVLLTRADAAMYEEKRRRRRAYASSERPRRDATTAGL